ncbi:hypothetical protein T05_8595 [Trichinella murrelli]|uniref:Uncharacterized protein n=1 Tax=Trichinella murrelli TaxID=144512 RepID=A0A0V0T6D8_9BILA|nr:hypothetical protein T05_8595 [Trichinella murrelli]
MDFDMNVRLTRSGEITQELIVFLMLIYLLLTSELTSENVESVTLSKAEFRRKKKRMSLIDATFKDNKSLHFQKQHLVVPVFCKNQLNISAIISIYYFLKLIVEQPHYVYATHCIWNSQIIESELETFLRSMVFFQCPGIPCIALRSCDVLLSQKH